MKTLTSIIALTAIAVFASPAYAESSQSFNLRNCDYAATLLTKDLQSEISTPLPDFIIAKFPGLAEKIAQGRVTIKEKGDSPPHNVNPPDLPVPTISLSAVRVREIDKDTGNINCAALVVGDFGKYYGQYVVKGSMPYRVMHTAEGGVFVEYTDPFEE